MDPFSLILEGVRTVAGSIASELSDRLVNRVLSVWAECASCGRGVHGVQIEDGAVNALHCALCGYEIRQYTNATPRTIRGDSAILAACATRPYWDDAEDDGFTFRPTFDVDVVHGNNEDLVASLHVRRFGEETPLYSKQVHFSACGKRVRHKIAVTVPLDVIPEETDVFAVDVFVQNAWGDELDRVRRVSNTVRVR